MTPEQKQAAILFVVGVFIDVMAAPYCYEASTAAMAKEWQKVIVGYAIGIPLALIGISTVAVAFGILPLSAVSSIAIYVQPLATDARWWLLIWFVVLVWIGGPRFVGRMRTAWRKGGFRPRVVYDQFKDEYNPPNGLLYTHLWFRNAGGDAWEVEPHITWTPKGKKDQVLFDGTAKWKETPWNAGRGIHARNRIPIPNDGKPHLLDLCVRKPAAADFYWLDIESARGGAIRPDRLFQAGIYDVYVDLTCDEYAAHFRFEVQIVGNAAPQVTLIA